MSIELPEERLSRRRDPKTSLAAARKASKASKVAVGWVAIVMSDEVPRIDGEIWEACRAAGYLSSLSTIQHGRLALSEAGLLKETGVTRRTKDGAQSREWVAKPNILMNISFSFKPRKKKRRKKTT